VSRWIRSADDSLEAFAVYRYFDRAVWNDTITERVRAPVLRRHRPLEDYMAAANPTYGRGDAALAALRITCGGSRTSCSCGGQMNYMIARCENGDGRPVYRFRERGCMAPDVGLTYVASWVETILVGVAFSAPASNTHRRSPIRRTPVARTAPGGCVT
jgi:hypothetical protein